MEIAIKMNGINKRYKNNEIFRDFNLYIYKNTTIEIAGQNGCGKTTLIEIIAGLVKVDSGSIEIFNQKDFLLYNKRIGYSFSFDYLYGQYTLKKNFKILSNITSIPFCQYTDLLAEFQLESYYDKNVNTLSEGMKQRLKLVFCLAKKPEILILDEPTVHLDKASIEILLAKLEHFKRNGCTIILTTHNSEHLKTIVDSIIRI